MPRNRFFIGSETNQIELQAMSISMFCLRYGICRSRYYAEWAAGRIHPKKSGRRVIIPVSEAERWLASLPNPDRGEDVFPHHIEQE